jgi:hypothetical protein
MRHSRHYYAKRAYRQRQYNKVYNAKMQARERAVTAAKNRRAAKKAEWKAWHGAHPGERWAPGEKKDFVTGLVIAGLSTAVGSMACYFRTCSAGGEGWW